VSEKVYLWVFSGEPWTAAKVACSIVFLAVFWTWESWRPFFGFGESAREGRYRHAVRNVALAVANTAVVTLALAGTVVAVAEWSAVRELGLLARLPLGPLGRCLVALLLLDAWMYVWHRANHRLPVLWRFHRVHHSDENMDVTTAARFHLGEVLLAQVLRLGLIPILGLSAWHLVLYDLLMNAAVQFHHADISLGRWDAPLRWLVVTPDMHKIHHSDWHVETDSNYATVLSIWDHLARSYCMRRDLHAIRFGVTDLREPQWQTIWGLLWTPLIALRRPSPRSPRDAAADSTITADR